MAQTPKHGSDDSVTDDPTEQGGGRRRRQVLAQPRRVHNVELRGSVVIQPRVRGTITVTNQDDDGPRLLLQSIIETTGTDPDGLLVRAVALPWFELLALLKRDPNAIYSSTNPITSSPPMTCGRSLA